MSEDSLIGIVEKNRAQDVRVRLVEYNAKSYLDVRVFVTVDATGDRVPTRKGVALAVEKIAELRELIEKAEAESAGA